MARRKRSEAQEARRFGVILAILMALCAGFSLWRQHPTRAAVFGGIGLVALLLPLLAAPLWLRLFRLWMKLAEALSWVMTRVILSVFFFVVLTPIGLLMKLFRKAPLDLRFRDGKPSYWIDKPPIEGGIERYERQY